MDSRAPDPVESFHVEGGEVRRLRRHFHSRHELILIERGGAVHGVEDQKYAVSAGSLVAVSRLERHEVRVTDPPYHRRYLLLDPAFFQDAVRDPVLLSLFRNRPAGFSHHVRLEGEDFAAVRDAFERIHAEAARSDRFHADALAGLLRMLAVDLYRRIPRLFPAGTAPRGSRRVADAQALIEAQFARRDLSLSAIAAGVFCSDDHLSHLFKRWTGYPVMRYVTLQRIARAKELLAEGDLPVEQVGKASGFGDASHFIRTFRTETGETPLRFRKRMQRTGEP